MMGVAMIRAACLDLPPTRIIYNRSTGSANPQRAPHARAAEVASAVFLEPIFRQRSTPWPCKASRRRRHDAKQHIRSARHHHHTSSAETPLRRAAKTRRRRRVRCLNTPPLLARPNQQLLQNDAPRRENDPERAVIVRSGRPRSRVSPGAVQDG